ncbi:MAG TPA: hypothetical protein PK921_02950, partial [Candidatus Portnoybacteria bacterium]|nr:hypothetical protein [Candidatus Portnoybacteria bacterium]
IKIGESGWKHLFCFLFFIHISVFFGAEINKNHQNNGTWQANPKRDIDLKKKTNNPSQRRSQKCHHPTKKKEQKHFSLLFIFYLKTACKS